MSRIQRKNKDGIYLDGSEVLTRISTPVDLDLLKLKSTDKYDINNKKFIEIKSVITMLGIIMDKYKGAQGLSAIQIGVDKRICMIRSNDVVYVMINPRLIVKLWWQMSNEGCYSTGDKRYMLWRPLVGCVSYYNTEGNKCIKWLNKKIVRVVSHEIDHMNGKLISRGKEYIKNDKAQDAINTSKIRYL